MKRLIKELGYNSPESYDQIYFERLKGPVNGQDIRRWKKLIKLFKEGKVIDLGCLDSGIPSLLKKRLPYPRFEYLGVDIAENALADMQRQYADDLNIDFEIMDIYKIRFVDGIYDYAILGEVIEHMERPAEVIKEAMRILKKGGTLALSTPLNEAIEPGAVDAERHLWSFTADDIIKLLKPYGEVQIYTLGSEYLPRYIYHFPTLIAWCKKQHGL